MCTGKRTQKLVYVQFSSKLREERAGGESGEGRRVGGGRVWCGAGRAAGRGFGKRHGREGWRGGRGGGGDRTPKRGSEVRAGKGRVSGKGEERTREEQLEGVWRRPGRGQHGGQE